MKAFFLDDKNQLSMGRLLSLFLFIVCTSVWIGIEVTGRELTPNTTMLIQWGWITAIVGKAAGKAAEAMKK